MKDLKARTILGVFDWEKKEKREVILNIDLHVQNMRAGSSDDLSDTIDYAMLEQEIVRRLDASAYNLIEKLVADIGSFILSLDKRIAKVVIEADKEGALQYAKFVSVQAEFSR